MQTILVILGISFLFFGLEDIFIDFIAYFKKLRPRNISSSELSLLKNADQKKIAIIVPAWDESNVIEHMLRGNIHIIDYDNYHFFLGVYPNDQETIDAVKRVQKIYPFVHPVINSKEGPSSKGQMLNEVIQYILNYESEADLKFDGFIMQDSEDAIHPLMFLLANSYLSKYDFIQTPVFSLPVSPFQLVGGIYMDEFAELHTKDLLVRSYLKAGVPSAGVGTILSRNLVLNVLAKRQQCLFNEGSVTEDYELGISSHLDGFSAHFISEYYIDELTNKKEFIATREYFPKKFSSSIRQKARWTVGIVFQGWKQLSWTGPFLTKYFLYRDRKGIIANVLALMAYVTLAVALVLNENFQNYSNFAKVIFITNLILMLNRCVQRWICTHRVYGASQASLMFVRWPLGVVINSFAGVVATKRFLGSWLLKSHIKWNKTEHELPEFLLKQSQASQQGS